MQQIPVIIDVEASGFGPHSYPIEIGTADHQQHRFCTLITPIDSWTHWDDQAEKVHNISRAQLLDSGRDIVEVAQLLNRRFAGQTLYSDGWVVDKPWLETLFYAAGTAMAFHVSTLEMILSEGQMAIWHDEKRKVITELRLDRHRASNDALIIQQTFLRTRQLTERAS